MQIWKHFRDYGNLPAKLVLYLVGTLLNKSNLVSQTSQSGFGVLHIETG